MLFGDTDITSQCALQATAHGVTVYRSNGYATERRQFCKGFTKELGHLIGPGFVAIGKGFKIGARGEEFPALPGQEPTQNVRVFVKLTNGFVSAGRESAVQVLAGGLLMVSIAMCPRFSS